MSQSDLLVSGTATPLVSGARNFVGACEFPTIWQGDGRRWPSSCKGSAMSASTRDPPSFITVNGIRVEMIERGRGRPLLFLHPAIGLDGAAPALDRLAERARVIAPSHPGFGASEQPRAFDTIDALAYLYLDLLDQLDLTDTIVVGVSLGAWIAAEIAVKSSA